jgi:hypothetical protein
MAKPPAFNRQTQGSIPWRGTGGCSFPVKLTRLKRRAENAEELVRLQPPGLTRSVREVSGSLPGSQPGRAGSTPAERSARARYRGRTYVAQLKEHSLWEREVAGANPVVTFTASGTRAGNSGSGPGGVVACVGSTRTQVRLLSSRLSVNGPWLERTRQPPSKRTHGGSIPSGPTGSTQGVAQFGRALGLGPRGRGFESLHLDYAPSDGCGAGPPKPG